MTELSPRVEEAMRQARADLDVLEEAVRTCSSSGHAGFLWDEGTARIFRIIATIAAEEARRPVAKIERKWRVSRSITAMDAMVELSRLLAPLSAQG